MGGWRFYTSAGAEKVTQSDPIKPWYVGETGADAVTSSSWSVANNAVLVPFEVQTPVTLSSIVFACSATGGGNYDVGIYTEAGTRLVSKGSTALSVATITATFSPTTLQPGRYWLALSCSSATATFYATSPTTASVQRAVASSHPLPTPITPGSTTPSLSGNNNGLGLLAPVT